MHVNSNIQDSGNIEADLNNPNIAQNCHDNYLLQW